MISLAIEPKTRPDQEKLGIALGRLAQEDPSFRVTTDRETNQTIISGMGELHLEIIVDRLKREYGVEANVGKPQVAYRETIRKPAKGEEKYVRQTGGRGQYGHAVLEIAPNPGAGFEFVNEIVGGVIPREYIPAVEKAWSKRWKAASWPATKWWTSKSGWSSAASMKSTRQKWRSRSRARSLSRPPPGRPARRCSNR